MLRCAGRSQGLSRKRGSPSLVFILRRSGAGFIRFAGLRFLFVQNCDDLSELFGDHVRVAWGFRTVFC